MTMQSLSEALVRFQRGLQPVAFDATSQVQHRTYRYATLAAIMQAIREPLAANGLCVI